MSAMNSHPALRWLVPATAAVAAIGGGATIGTLSAQAEPSLPPRSAAQLLVDLQTARLDGMSGTVVQTADLGLPALPSLGGGRGSSDLTSLVSGTHTLRVWYAGPDRARVALMGTLGETDVIRNGRDVWVWESQKNQVSHRTLAANDGETGKPEPLPSRLPSTPQEAADQALAAINPSTEVTVGRSAMVAGRSAYDLVLAPRDKSSLVGQVRIAIDSKEHVPLRLEVYPKDSDKTAFSVAFTQIDFARPDAQQFRFNPPPGAKVTEQSGAPRRGPSGRPESGKPGPGKPGPGAGAAARPKTVGTGWTTVVVAKAPQGLAGITGGQTSDKKAGDRNGGAQLNALLGNLPKVNGAWGSGRLLSGKLFSALLTDDGRVLVGAVSPQRLYEVASSAEGK